MVQIFGAEVSGFVLTLNLLTLYFLVLFVLVKTGWLQKLGMSLFGPALMIKTQRGRGLLDWLAKPGRFWRAAATVGTTLSFVVMGLMSLLLIVQLPFIFRVPVSEAPSPSLILGIPGINPIIPLGYGIVALIFAVVVHELSHGVLARVHKLQVKTMGILLFVIPIGAFVEPDEEALKRAPRRHRVEVFGAGPTSNLFFAILFAAIFSGALMAQASPVPGAPIVAVDPRGPACTAGLQPSWIVTHMSDGPDRSGARPIADRDQLSSELNATTPGDTIHLFVRATRPVEETGAQECSNETNDAAGVYPIRTIACSQLYEVEDCRLSGEALNHPDPSNRTVIGINLYNTQEVHAALAEPLSSPRRALAYFSLPFFALQGQFPLAGAFQDFYEVPFHEPTFWILANLAYWLFWINLMLGLTNALPILPLDGGHMFRDLVGHWVQKRNPTIGEPQRDAIVRRLSLIVTFTLLGLVLLQFVGPYIAALFT